MGGVGDNDSRSMLTIRKAQMDQMEQATPDRPVVMPCQAEVCPFIHLEEQMLSFPPAPAGTVTATPPDAPAKAPAAPNPPAPSVAPGVATRGVVVVKKKHTSPVRVPVVLTTDKAFTGKGTFTAAPADKILFFRAKKGGSAIKFNGTDNVFAGAALTKGVTLFAEGAHVSGLFNGI